MKHRRKQFYQILFHELSFIQSIVMVHKIIRAFFNKSVSEVAIFYGFRLCYVTPSLSMGINLNSNSIEKDSRVRLDY